MVPTLASKQNQRLGPRPAGPPVVRAPPPPPRPRRAGADVVPPPPPAPWTKPLPDAGVEWDVSAISQEEFAAVRQFLERRWAIDAAARQRLAWQLAEGLRPKVAGVPPELHGEPLLEQLAAAKAARLSRH